MKQLKTILLLASLLFITFGYTQAFEGQQYVDNVEFGDDGSIKTENTIIEDNNVVGPGNTQITDSSTTAGDVNVDKGIATDVNAIDTNTNASTTLESSSELEITNKEGKVEVTQLPTTGPETVLLLIISLLVTSFVLFKNKNARV